MRRLEAFLVSGWILIAGCRGSREPAPDPGGLPSGDGSGEPIVASPVATIRLLLDGKEIAPPVTPAPNERVAIASALPTEAPASSWRQLLAVSLDGKRSLDISRFADRYGDYEVALYRDAGHGVSLGLFRRPSESLPAHLRKKLEEPHLSLVDVATIEVRTREADEGRPAESAAITLKLGGEARTLTATELERIARVVPPGLAKPGSGRGRAEKRAGWLLHEVLASARHARTRGPFVARGASGESLSLPDLNPPGSIVLLRLNHRGQFEIGIWSGDATVPSAQLRGVTAIELAPASTARPHAPGDGNRMGAGGTPR